ncbi:MAG TPA: hypothetical protein VD929_01385 [Caulobacteraceae bacterium]|nr:hypothetical protein [Caulobacteraceae bacterium]
MLFRCLLACGAGLAALVLTAPASSAQAPGTFPKTAFSNCDGYGKPSKSGDGMTEQAFTMGIFVPLNGRGDTTKTVVLAGADGVTACDAALADPALLPKYAVRRATLLRARALHRLATGAAEAALADLETADAALPPGDVYARRSVGLGAGLIRAFGLYESGRPQEGRAAVAAAVDARAYNRQALRSAALVLDAVDGPVEDRERVLRAQARLDPETLARLFDFLVEQGRFQEAVDLHPQIKPMLDKGGAERFDFEVRILEAKNQAVAELFWATKAGPLAYAHAALGRGGQAREVLAAARERLKLATGPVPPRLGRDGEPKKPDVADRYAELYRKSLALAGGEALDRWTAAAEAREALSAGRPEPADALASEGGKGIPGLVALEFVRARRALMTEAERTRAGPEPEAASLWNALSGMTREQLVASALLQSLPEAELKAQIPPYKDAPHPRFSMKNSYNDLAVVGHRSETDPKTGVTTVRVRVGKGSSSVPEEMALLRAAELAEQAGKRLLIVDRRDYRHVYSTTQYGTVLNSSPDGFSTELDVLFVDPASPPAGYEKAGWRMLDPAEVRTALSPVYPAAAAGS